MMKKKGWIAALAASVVLGGAIGVNAVQASSGNAEQTIGASKAGRLALAAAPGTIDEIELERKNGKLVYEVDIDQGRDDVDVWIDAYSGKVLAVKGDDDYRSHTEEAAQTGSRQGVTAAEKAKATIGAAKAKQIALQEVGGKVVEVDLDRDDGVLKYEIELRTADGEAEVDIHAYTGQVLKVELDHDDDDGYDD